ncbi:MAG: hypothetical protein RXP97_01215 [Nitrososphaeria archaeon]
MAAFSCLSIVRPQLSHLKAALPLHVFVHPLGIRSARPRYIYM